jgi:hypothetical protein
MPDREETWTTAHPERRSGAHRLPAPLAATTYYAAALIISTGFFFLVWGVLRDNAAESPDTTAAFAACIVFAGAVILREFFLRGALSRQHKADRRADEMHAETSLATKLSVEQNGVLLAEIKKRSDAANLLTKIAAAHKEVFEVCAEYLTLIEGELSRMNAGSPRLEPFLKGRTRAAEAHRYHMLRWAELEATELTLRAQGDKPVDVRLEDAIKALWVVDTAINAYPAERTLLDSRTVLRELKVSLEVEVLVSGGEAAFDSGDRARARQLFRDALFVLARDHADTPGRRQAAERISERLETIISADQ